MDTPILDFVEKYNSGDITRMHMPGHKGAAFLGFESKDITEIKGADSLYHADGIIAQSECNATKIFNSGKTVYSTEGSSICIKTMLYLAYLNWKKNIKDKSVRPVVVAARNAHVSFVHTAMLLDFDVVWIWPENSDGNILSCNIDADKLRDILKKYGEKVMAVYVTSPDYLGNISDIKGLSEACHKEKRLLIVDNAHGAYLGFLEHEKYNHPLALGADMCCDSAHKTLPVLTGGAYLHLGKNLDKLFYDKVKTAMNVFGSTSPSYLILESLDLCNKILSEGYGKRLNEFIAKIDDLKCRLVSFGYNIMESDPLRITIKSENSGKISDILRSNKIECEYSDEEYVVLMLTSENSQDDMDKLEKVLEKNKDIVSDNKNICFNCKEHPKAVMTIREAMMQPQEKVLTDKALGRVCGMPLVSCPPAIPIVVSGELIDEFAIEMLKRYNIDSVECVI